MASDFTGIEKDKGKLSRCNFVLIFINRKNNHFGVQKVAFLKTRIIIKTNDLFILQDTYQNWKWLYSCAQIAAFQKMEHHVIFYYFLTISIIS